jgi:hypothetical protein
LHTDVVRHVRPPAAARQCAMSHACSVSRRELSAPVVHGRRQLRRPPREVCARAVTGQRTESVIAGRHAKVLRRRSTSQHGHPPSRPQRSYLAASYIAAQRSYVAAQRDNGGVGRNPARLGTARNERHWAGMAADPNLLRQERAEAARGALALRRTAHISPGGGRGVGVGGGRRLAALLRLRRQRPRRERWLVVGWRRASCDGPARRKALQPGGKTWHDTLPGVATGRQRGTTLCQALQPGGNMACCKRAETWHDTLRHAMAGSLRLDRPQCAHRSAAHRSTHRRGAQPSHCHTMPSGACVRRSAKRCRSVHTRACQCRTQYSEYPV